MTRAAWTPFLAVTRSELGPKGSFTSDKSEVMMNCSNSTGSGVI